MPVVYRDLIADYHTIQSKHFFPGYYIITSGVNFTQGISTNSDSVLKLTSSAGPNITTTGNESVSYSGVLRLPVIITESPRTSWRLWRDGLDFLQLILGQGGEYVNTSDNKVITYNNNDYDAVVIDKITFDVTGNSDLSVDVSFTSNVEDVFNFENFQGVLLNPFLQTYLPEMRTARTFDISFSVQTMMKQLSNRVMLSGNVTFDQIIDKFVIQGSRRPRQVFKWCNYKVTGNFKLLDDINRYSSFIDEYSYQLYKPNFQKYGTMDYERGSNYYDWGIDFFDLMPDSNIKFSRDGYYHNVSRSIEQGVLMSNVSFGTYNNL